MNLKSKVAITITAQMQRLQNILISLLDISPLFYAGIMAEIVDINCLRIYGQLVKYAGFAWNNISPGVFKLR